MTSRGWRQPPWFARPGARAAFWHQLDDLDGVQRGRNASHPSGFVVSFSLQPAGVPKRQIVVQFMEQAPNTPRVFVNGPADSPHRYDDGTLCMWHPSDPRSLRWEPPDGAADLVVRIGVHLVKEEWYRETGEWIGAEVRHHPRDDANDPEDE